MRKTIFNPLLILLCIIITASMLIGCVGNHNNTENAETLETIEPTMMPTEPDNICPPTEVPTEPATEPPATESVEVEPIRFSPDITMEYEYVNDRDMMPYYLFSPSVESEYDIPLIVWLHGGARSISEDEFKMSGGIQTFLNWESECINAYIVCPHRIGDYEYKGWHSVKAMNDVKLVIADFVMHNNIDTSRIYVVGHSTGGQGALYMAAKAPEYFAACATLSPFMDGLNTKFYEMPVTAYIGTKSLGEDEGSIFFANSLGEIIGHDNVVQVESNHSNLPHMVFTMDNDENNRADIIEWLFEHKKTAELDNAGCVAKEIVGSTTRLSNNRAFCHFYRKE